MAKKATAPKSSKKQNKTVENKAVPKALKTKTVRNLTRQKQIIYWVEKDKQQGTLTFSPKESKSLTFTPAMEAAFKPFFDKQLFVIL